MGHSSIAAVGGQGNTVFSVQVPGQTPREGSEMAHKGAARPPLSPLTLLAATQATSRYWSSVAFMGCGEAGSKTRRSETQMGRVSAARVSCHKCLPEQLGVSAHLPECYPHVQIVDRHNGKFEAAGLRFHRLGSFLLSKQGRADCGGSGRGKCADACGAPPVTELSVSPRLQMGKQEVEER